MDGVSVLGRDNLQDSDLSFHHMYLGSKLGLSPWISSFITLKHLASTISTSELRFSAVYSLVSNIVSDPSLPQIKIIACHLLKMIL